MAKSETVKEEFDLYAGKCKVVFYPNSHRYTVNGKPTSGSVTGIIGIKDKSGGLVPWAVGLAVDHLTETLSKNKVLTQSDFDEAEDLHTVKKDQAATIGSIVHDWVENYIKGNKPEIPEMREAQIGVNAFLDWFADNKVVFKSSERAVYSKKHDYIGKMDIEAKVNGKLCLLDIKTSNDLNNGYYLQTAAYVRADEEESGREYHGRWLIRLAKETEKEYNARMAKKNAKRVRKGKEPIVFPTYKVFEPMFLDNEDGNMDRDFKAFLACKTLATFEKDTGFYAKLAGK